MELNSYFCCKRGPPEQFLINLNRINTPQMNNARLTTSGILLLSPPETPQGRKVSEQAAYLNLLSAVLGKPSCQPFPHQARAGRVVGSTPLPS